MEKLKSYSVVMLSFCSLSLEFLMLENAGIIFPRDRLLHILISVALSVILIVFLERVNINNIFFKCVFLTAILMRIIYICTGYINYFQVFHGSNTIGIIFFTIVTAIMFFWLIYENTQGIYIFFALVNLFFILMLLVLCVKKMNVSNLYSNELLFLFNPRKLFMLFDVISIYIIIDDKHIKFKTYRKYILISAVFLSLITILQGMCIGGNVLYRISPLQALIQIISSKTILRYGYLFTIWSAINYFGAIMLYSWSIKKLIGDNHKHV